MSAVIVATGARGPAGLRAVDTVFLVRASAPVLRAAPLLDPDGELVTMGFLPTLDPLSTGGDRLRALGIPALDELALALGPGASSLRARLSLALDEGPRDAAALLAADLVRGAQRHFAAVDLDVAARGAASTAFLLGPAIAALDGGVADVVVLGGVHTDYDPQRIAELAAQGRLFRPDRMDALIPGEQAAFVALMRDDVARRAMLLALAEIRGVTTGFERARPDNDESALAAAGLTAAMRQAQRDTSGGPVGWVLTDLTFETFRHLELSAVTTRTQKGFCEPQRFDHPAQRVGHLGAAAMPFGLLLAAEGFRRGYAPHPRAMILAGSDGGERGVIVVAATS